MRNWSKNKSRPAGRGTGVNGAATYSTTSAPAEASSAAGTDLDGALVVQRKHTDWIEHQIRWRWLLDSYEGGDRYRNAVYGPDRRGLPCRNLFRHKREYPDPQTFPTISQGFGSRLAVGETTATQTGSGLWPGQLGADASAVAMDDDYEL